MLGDTALSLESYVIGTRLTATPSAVTIELIAYLRPIAEFADEASLIRQIKRDVADTKQILRRRRTTP